MQNSFGSDVPYSRRKANTKVVGFGLIAGIMAGIATIASWNEKEAG